MKNLLAIAAFLLATQCIAADAAPSVPPDKDATNRADRRYEEMLSRMQSSIEDIAQMYGNPTFLQIFTNDVARAAELKERLHSEKSGQAIEKELRELTRKRDGLLDDIALKERETARLTRKLAAQRAALDAVAGAIEQAKSAVEDTSK
ncbi:MAG TPA: hypothetical protein VFE25_10595 [Opitutaceae bacterium]|jgi:hypothetical protein|nr:hypothetical protein [Opitutaceae bacterium]